MLGHLEALGVTIMTKLGVFTQRPRITVPEARKLLGSKHIHLNDDQVQDLIATLTLIARNNLKYLGSNNVQGSDSIES